MGRNLPPEAGPWHPSDRSPRLPAPAPRPMWDYRLDRMRQQWRERRIRTATEKPPRRLPPRSGYADV